MDPKSEPATRRLGKRTRRRRRNENAIVEMNQIPPVDSISKGWERNEESEVSEACINFVRTSNCV
jgi:hypothetical protein